MQLICLLLALPLTSAHFPLVDNAHGGPVFYSRTTALNITDITRSQFTDRVQTCDYPYLWLKFSRPANFTPLMVGGTVPVVERFKDIGVAVAVIAPGLPGSSATQSEVNDVCGYSPVGRECVSMAMLPSTVKDQIPDGYGAVGVPAADSSTCDFGEDPQTLTTDAYFTSSGGDDVRFATYVNWTETHCFFHEEFGGSDMWIVQDKLIDLKGEGTHYIVYWAPGDGKIGEPTTPAKFGAVCGDKGQSEDGFTGGLQAGECSLPAQDFYEMDCHGAEKWRMDVAELIPEGTNIPWGLLGGAPCRPSYAVSIPNFYQCPATSEGVKCNQLCHNHGICPAGNTTTCDEPLLPTSGCGETCHWQECGMADPDVKRGPVGPACVETCREKCDFLVFNCKEECGFPSPECKGVYEEHEGR